MDDSAFPAVGGPGLVGSYSAPAQAGGGFVWDEVLVTASGATVLAFSQATPGAEEPLALVLQEEYIEEPEPGVYVHYSETRVTEWPLGFSLHRAARRRRFPRFLPLEHPRLASTSCEGSPSSGLAWRQ